MDLDNGRDYSSADRIAETEVQLSKLSTDIAHNEEILRNLLLNICNKFTVILTEHMLNCKTDGTEFETNFYNFVAGRFKYIFLKHSESIWKV